MGSRLDRITDWEERAAKARYRVSHLAAECRVTERQLRRFIHDKFGAAPVDWMTELRLQNAPALLQQGDLVKEIAAKLGYSPLTFPVNSSSITGPARRNSRQVKHNVRFGYEMSGLGMG